MKLFSAISMVAIAASSASAETCVLTELATTLVGVISPATECQTATGYTILPPSALPTAAQVTAICSQCQTLISAAKSVTFPSCTLTIDGSEVAIDTLFASIVGQCSANTSTEGSGSGSSSTPAVTVAATESPSAAASSTASSSDSAVTSDASSSSSLLADTEITTPETTTTTPSTTTTAPSTISSSAPSVTQTVGAAVVVVAAAATTMLL